MILFLYIFTHSPFFFFFFFIHDLLIVDDGNHLKAIIVTTTAIVIEIKIGIFQFITSNIGISKVNPNEIMLGIVPINPQIYSVSLELNHEKK